MTHRAETLELKSGVCCVCGCTERKPCALEFVDEDGETAAVACTWVDAARTLCSNPDCLEMARVKRRERAAAAGAVGTSPPNKMARAAQLDIDRAPLSGGERGTDAVGRHGMAHRFRAIKQLALPGIPATRTLRREAIGSSSERGSMARQRYQKGHVYPDGEKWKGRYRDDIITLQGTKRIRREVIQN